MIPPHSSLSITFSGVTFRIPRLYQFINRAEGSKPSDRVVFDFYATNIDLKFMPSNGFELSIRRRNLSGQVSSMAVVCRELSPLLSRVERLDLLGKRLDLRPGWQDIVDPMQWQELFHSFIAVQGLYVSKKLGSLISPALQAFTDERATEVLPSLLYLFFEGFWPSGRVHEATKLFVTARQQSGFPVAVLRWVRELDGYSEFGDWEVDE